MDYQKLSPVYIKVDKDLKIVHGTVTVEEVFGSTPLSENLFFGFEKEYAPYAPFILETLPRIELVTYDISGVQSKCLKPLEIKLTALPDNQTVDLQEKDYGCEIVVRPDSIVYVALKIAIGQKGNRPELLKILAPVFEKQVNWEETESVLPLMPEISSAVEKLLEICVESQSPFMMQPVWKTIGKSLRLAEYCFDIFVWSNLSFVKLFLDVAKRNLKTISRHSRSVVWVAYMLYQFAKQGRIDHAYVIDKLSYNTKNDKAFACSGNITNPYMRSQQLLKPRLKREVVREIILGGGHKFLSPERRLDAAILNSEGLFSN